MCAADQQRAQPCKAPHLSSKLLRLRGEPDGGAGWRPTLCKLWFGCGGSALLSRGFTSWKFWFCACAAEDRVITGGGCAFFQRQRPSRLCGGGLNRPGQAGLACLGFAVRPVCLSDYLGGGWIIPD